MIILRSRNVFITKPMSSDLITEFGDGIGSSTILNRYKMDNVYDDDDELDRLERYVFQLTSEEVEFLRSQEATLNEADNRSFDSLFCSFSLLESFLDLMRGWHVLVMITCNMICSLPSLRIFEDNVSLGSSPSDSLSKDTNFMSSHWPIMSISSSFPHQT